MVLGNTFYEILDNLNQSLVFNFDLARISTKFNTFSLVVCLGVFASRIASAQDEVAKKVYVPLAKKGRMGENRSDETR